jgi:hypothetical protein
MLRGSSSEANILRGNIQNRLFLQCRGVICFKDLNLDRRMNYFRNGKLCNNEDIFEEGDHIVRFSDKLLGGKGGDYDSTSDDDESEYEYEEDEETPDEEVRKELKPGMVRNFKEICEQEDFHWDPEVFIDKEIDPKFDELVTRARSCTPDNEYTSNRQFYVIYNIKKFQIRRDDKDDGRIFNRFANGFLYFVNECEYERLEWPFEKFYWELWELLKQLIEDCDAN